jgi:hypothetical protein
MPAFFKSRLMYAAKNELITDPKASVAHVKTCPASVPTLIVVSLDTGPDVVTVFCVTGGTPAGGVTAAGVAGATTGGGGGGGGGSVTGGGGGTFTGISGAAD